MNLLQSHLDHWFLRQDIFEQLINAEETDEEASRYADRILQVAQHEESEHQVLVDPFDRSVALVLSLVKEEGLNPWDIDLSAFLTIFAKRVKAEADDLDLPACGRLIRLAWEVLNNQASSLLEKIQDFDLLEEEEFFHEFGWESDYDEEEFFFTNSVIDGNADEVLPNLFDERLRRTEEGRPVTLGELLSALKEACDDAEIQKEREEIRRLNAIELRHMLANVEERIHDENLDGDIEMSWNAFRSALTENGKNVVSIEHIRTHLQNHLSLTGRSIEESFNEAKVIAFVASLFLTHRGYASVSQDTGTNGEIYLQDLWPKALTYDQISNSIEEKKKNQDISDESVNHLAERASSMTSKPKSEVMAELDEWLVE